MSLLQTKYVNDEIHYLFACCYERKIGLNAWKGDILYTHAKDEAAARFICTQNLIGLRCEFRLVAIAPAIGFKVLDEHAEKLIA